MSDVPSDFRLLNHYTVFFYPFVHNIQAENRSTRIQTLAESWGSWWSRLEDIATALDSTYFFLPYIREVLFPETIAFKDQPPGPNYENWLREIRLWNERGLPHFVQQLTTDAVLRLTYKQPLLQQIKNFDMLELDHNGTLSQTLPATIDWIDALVFPSGVGFLMLKIQLRGPQAQLTQLIDLNYNFRLVHAPSVDWHLPQLRFNQQANMLSVRDLLDFLTQGMAGDEEVINDLWRWKEHLAAVSPKRLSEGEAGQVYGERCHIFSYACVNVAKDAAADAGGVFESLKDRLVFEYASSLSIGSSVKEPTWMPSAEFAKSLKASNQISIWNAWTGMALKESAVFLGTEDIGFNKHQLAHNVENDYLPLYAYSLYQKYQLFIFADQLMRKGAYVAEHLNEVRALMDRFIDFRTRYWFNEVTRKALGGELYAKFRHGLDIVSLCELVSQQARDLKEHYEERRRRRIDVLLNIFTFVFLPLSAAVGVFGMTFFEEGSWPAFAMVIALILAISLGVWTWWTRESGPKIGQ